MSSSKRELDAAFVAEIVGQPVKKFTLSEGSKKGDNNIGKMLALNVETEEGVILDVVVKSLLPLTGEADASTICQSKLFTALQVFPAEILYYQNVRPLLAQVNGSSWCDKPHIFSSKDVGSTKYIALQDLRPQGYKMADKRKGLTLGEVTAVLKKLAVLHAHSYSVLSQNHPAMQELVENSPLNGHVWLRRFSDLDLERFFNVYIEKMMELMSEIGEVETANKMKKFVKTGYKILIDLWENRGKSPKYFQVVLHGDLWTNNVLFKHAPDGETIQDLVFIDFQQCRFGTIYEDLLYFMFSSTTAEFRKQNLKVCLQSYFDAFDGALENLKNPIPLPAGFTKEGLIATFYENIEYGYCYDVVAIPFQLGRDDGPPPDQPAAAAAPTLNEQTSAMQLALMTSEAMKLETKNCSIAVQRLRELCAEMCQDVLKLTLMNKIAFYHKAFVQASRVAFKSFILMVSFVNRLHPLRFEMARPLQMSKASPYFVPFLKFLSLIYVAPFILVKCPKTKEYFFVKSKSRLIISAFLNILIVILNFLRVAGSLMQYIKIRHDISTTFYNVSKLGTCLGITIFQRLLWWEQQNLEIFIQRTTIICNTKNAIWSLIMTTIGCALISTSSIILGLYSAQARLELDPVYDILKGTIPSVLGFDVIQFVSDSLSIETKTMLTRILASISFVISNFIIIGMIVLALVFKHVLREHYRRDIEDSYCDILQFSRLYTKMKEMSTLGKAVFGPYILCYYISVLSFAAELPHILLAVSSSEDISRVAMSIYTGGICYSLGVASMAHTQIEEDLKKYISFQQFEKHLGTTERLQLIALTQDMESDPIALSSCFFAITRKFLGSTFSLLVTYSIIVFQMKDKERAFWEEAITQQPH